MVPLHTHIAGPALVPRACERVRWAHGFQRRARLYRDWQRPLQGITRFFAAAAWLNAFLAQLERRGLLGAAAGALLHPLGAHLLIKNRYAALWLARRAPGLPADHLLVDWEQRLVEVWLSQAAREDTCLHAAACGQIDAHLNSIWLQRGGPWMAAPLAAVARLARTQSLHFSCERDRCRIGYALLDATRA